MRINHQPMMVFTRNYRSILPFCANSYILMYTFDFPSHSVRRVFKLDDLTHIGSFANDTKFYLQANLWNCSRP